MYCWKSLGSRMEMDIPGKYPIQNSSKPSITAKNKVMPKTWPKIPWDLSLKRRPACQTLAKALNISIVTAGVFPDLLIELSWNQKRIYVKGHTSQGDQQTYFAHVFPASLTTKERLTGH